MFILCGEDWVRYDAIVSYIHVHDGIDVIDTNGVHHKYDGTLKEFQKELNREQGEI